MIISRTPHRISFFGGGTDYPDYYLKHGGRVLGMAINKYCYLSVRRLPPFFDFRHRIVYSKIESVVTVDEILHPAVKGVLKQFDTSRSTGYSIHHDGDIPARSGMGSSSAFTVGLLNSLHALDGRMVSKEELARLAIYTEQKVIKEHVGSQDQVFAAHGGLNVINFLTNGEVAVEPVIMPPDRLRAFEDRLMLFYTGISRVAAEVAEDKIKNIPNRKTNLGRMGKMVDEGFRILTSKKRELREFGELLNETWRLKKTLSNMVSNGRINEYYERARKAGAVGGKLLGAGGGGFMVFFVEPEKKNAVRKALKELLHVPFSADFTGSKIIVYQPEMGWK